MDKLIEQATKKNQAYLNKEVMKLKDPVQILDLIIVDAYFAGKLENEMPVERARSWFKKATNLIRQAALTQIESKLPNEFIKNEDGTIPPWYDGFNSCRSELLKVIERLKNE